MRAATAEHQHVPLPARQGSGAAARQFGPLPGLHRTIGNQGVLRLLGEQHGGHPLPPDLRSRFEPRFGQDLGGVRVHADGLAARSARSLSALAYTVGNHIVFAEGQYKPGTHVGDRILAHEIAHVLQQRRAAQSPDGTHVPLAASSDRHEAEAHRGSRAVALGQSAVVTSDAPLHVARLARLDDLGKAQPLSSRPSGVGITRQPVASARSRDPAAMSIEELEQEIRLLEQSLLDPSVSSTERVDVQIYLGVLRGNLAARARVTALERSLANVLSDRFFAWYLRQLDDAQARFSQSIRNLAAGLPPAQFAQVDAAIGVVDAIIDTFQSIFMFLIGTQAGAVELIVDTIVGLAKLVLFVVELLGRFLSDLIAFLLQQVGVDIHLPGESGREFALKAWAALENLPATIRASIEAWQARYRAAPPELKAAMLGRLLPEVVAALFAGVGAARTVVAGGRALLSTSAGRALTVALPMSVARVEAQILAVAPASTVPLAVAAPVATPVAAAAPLAGTAATAPLVAPVAEASAVAAPVAGALTTPELMSLAYAASLAPTSTNWMTAVSTTAPQPTTTTAAAPVAATEGVALASNFEVLPEAEPIEQVIEGNLTPGSVIRFDVPASESKVPVEPTQYPAVNQPVTAPFSTDPRALLRFWEQQLHVQFSPDVNPRAPWRGPYRFTPQPGQTITFGTFTYTWDENLNLVRASTTDISLGARDPVMYAGVPGMQAGEDYGHLLGADFGNIDAVIGRYGGFRQASSVNRPLGVAPALWYNAERIALATALQLKQSAQPFRVVAEARGFVNGVPAETRIFVESSNAIVYDSGWIANPIVP